MSHIRRTMFFASQFRSAQLRDAVCRSQTPHVARPQLLQTIHSKARRMRFGQHSEIEAQSEERSRQMPRAA